MSGTLIIGAGGHAKVVADILLCQGIGVLGYLDDNPSTWKATRLGLPILGPIDSYQHHAADALIVAVGDNAARKLIVERLGSGAQALWRSAIHPTAVVSASARVGVGVVIAAGAVVNPDSLIGDHAIINTSASIDHDCTIGAFTHVAPGTHLSGGVSLGEGVLVGVGSSIIPLCTVGNWSVIGAGAAVVSNIPDRVIAKGVPARWNNSSID